MRIILSWIELYFWTIIIWCFSLGVLYLVKKTRLFALSLVFSTMLFFVGLKVISSFFLTDQNYQSNKQKEFLALMDISGNDLAVNITPSAWLTSRDGRGLSSLVPEKFRDEIGGFFPLGSAPNVRTFYCQEDEGFISYTTDRFGFRNNDELWNDERHDIVILGDSFSESACVKTPLQDYFHPQKTIITLGKGGNGPLIALAALTEYLEEFKPEVVYHFVVPNDYSTSRASKIKIDLERELEETSLRVYLENKGPILNYFRSIDLSKLRSFAISYSRKLVMNNTLEKEELISYFSNIFSYDFLRSQILFAMNALYIGPHDFRFMERDLLEDVYSSMIKVANAKGVDLRFVLLPSKYSRCLNDSRHIYLKQVFSKLSEHPINLWGTMCNLDYFATKGVHFNAIGYQNLVKEIEQDFDG